VWGEANNLIMNSKKLKWKTDFDKEVVIENFIRRGWSKADKDDEDWNFYWATVWTVRNLFNPKSGISGHIQASG
jgi:tubulin polyglutamylase TTLL1